MHNSRMSGTTVLLLATRVTQGACAVAEVHRLTAVVGTHGVCIQSCAILTLKIRGGRLIDTCRLSSSRLKLNF